MYIYREGYNECGILFDCTGNNRSHWNVTKVVKKNVEAMSG
jgi:hypothetical protein